MSGKYILNDQRVCVPADLMTWARWFESSGAQRIVCKTTVGGAEVSTVFLGLDHSFGSRPRQLFETMVFGGPHDGEQERYATWEQAEAGHAATVARLNGAPASAERSEDAS